MSLEDLCNVVERCQALPEDGYTPDDYDLFVIAGRSCIEEGSSAQVLSIVLDDKNQDLVRSIGWTLFPALVEGLLKKEDKDLPNYLAIFNHLLQTCRPKELLIGLQEQLAVEDAKTKVERLLLLMRPLQKTLLRLDARRRASSLGLTLSSMMDHVAELPLPETKEQEEDDVFSLCRCCSELMEFVRPFVQEAARDNKSSDCVYEQEVRTELQIFFMSALKRIVLEVRLRDPETLELSPLRNFASDILKHLSAIGVSLPGLVFLPLTRRKKLPDFLEEETRHPRDALASLAHLVYVHHMATDTFPCVFSPVYTLRVNLEHVCHLLSSTNNTRIQKGLDLHEKTLLRLDDNTLLVELLEIKTFLTLSQDLEKVMTYCPEQELRTKGLKVFQLTIDKFDHEAKYTFFKLVLKTSTHSGLQGYIIKNIKNQVDFALQPGNANSWFAGVHLLPLLRFLFILPDGPETDLLKFLDRVMESLNLLRYLVIRDKAADNKTGIWTDFSKIEESFLKPLRFGLNMSRAHYEKELSGTMVGSKVKAEKITLSVGDQALPQMNQDSQIQALHSALHVFDMMESVLVRIEELVETKEHK
ncbi:glomulin, FKBP associated protein a [Neosynchiropus ocellatus]